MALTERSWLWMPEIQYFAENGQWTKPPAAVRVDILLKGAGGGGAFGVRSIGRAGQDGELRCAAFAASALPDTVEVSVGRGGAGALSAGDGADGYALILTHLEGDS